MATAQQGPTDRGEASSDRSTSSVFVPYAQFQIPFNIDAAGTLPASVQLLVSTDNGQTWQQHGKASARDRHFDFRAAAEGEYLFTVQTIDSSGVAFPSPNPPMRIRVDTSKPQANIRADLDHAGNLIIDLRVADEHLDLSSAVLKVRTDRDPQWREVSVTSLERVDNYFEGQVELLMPQCREVAIVFSILDQAKNSGEATYKFTMPRTAANNNDLQLASTPAQPQSAAQLQAQPQSLVGPQTGRVIQSPHASQLSADRNSASRGSATTANSAITNPASTSTVAPTTQSNLSPTTLATPGAIAWDMPRPAYGNTQDANSVRPSNPAAGNFASNSLQSATSATGSNTANQGNFPTTPRGSNLNAMNRPAGESRGPGQLARANLDIELGPSAPAQGPEELGMPRAMQPSVQTQADINLPSNQAGSTPYSNPSAPQPMQQAQQPQATNEEFGMSNPFCCRSQTFSLDYSVEALGGNALSEVELWGSEDNGRTWEKWGSDPDRVSPFDVKVGNDGLFGFRMVLVGAGGTVLGHPKPGEDADAWIRVDTESPACKITRAIYGVGSEAGMLVIDYTCTDAELADESLSLSWSPTPEGPWTVAATNMKNTGLYLWKAEAALPSRVYLKLEAVDKSGNTGVHRLELPIDTKGLAPRGRIQGIRPIVSPN